MPSLEELVDARIEAALRERKIDLDDLPLAKLVRKLELMWDRSLDTPASVMLPHARVYNSANLSIPNNSHTPLTFNSERVDVGLHSTTSNTGRLTAPDAGMYLITAHARFAANATGQRILTIRRNGTEEIARHSQPVNGSGVNTDMSVATVYRLSEGDYVDVWAYQNSGGNLNVLAAGNNSPEFAMVKLAD